MAEYDIEKLNQEQKDAIESLRKKGIEVPTFEIIGHAEPETKPADLLGMYHICPVMSTSRFMCECVKIRCAWWSEDLKGCRGVLR